MVFLKVCKKLILKSWHAKQKMGSEKLNVLPFNITVNGFDLEHHPLDINL